MVVFPRRSASARAPGPDSEPPSCASPHCWFVTRRSSQSSPSPGWEKLKHTNFSVPNATGPLTLGRDLVVERDHESHDDVEQNGGSYAQEGNQDPHNPDDGRIDLQVLAHAAANPGQHAVGGGARQAPWTRRVGSVPNGDFIERGSRHLFPRRDGQPGVAVSALNSVFLDLFGTVGTFLGSHPVISLGLTTDLLCQ